MTPHHPTDWSELPRRARALWASGRCRRDTLHFIVFLVGVSAFYYVSGGL
ncbi:hypothetical protein [Paremcibacter congregatus]